MIILLSIISAILYRLGGSELKWTNTKIRDLGCPTVLLIAVVINGQWSWWIVLSFFMMFGVLSTYNKWIDTIAGYPGNDVKKLAWIFTGFTYGIPMLPYAFVTGHWFGWFLYWLFTAAIFIFFRLVPSPIKQSDYWEECGSGISFIATLPLLF